jgi:hypothetical protein
MGRVSRERAYFLTLFAVGVLALALSYALEPTPDRYVYMRNYGGRVGVDAAMHAVDYLITSLRVGAVIALVSGDYLTYRSLRPDRIEESEGRPAYPDDRYAHVPPEAGNPGPRSGIG